MAFTRALLLFTLFGSAFSMCPSGYQHMTSVNCGKVGGKFAKLLTCSSFHKPTETKYLCIAPPAEWMQNACSGFFGADKVYTPVWEKTESSCYPDGTNPNYWFDYNKYTLTSDDFCSNFPKVKRTNNFQFERGTLLFWTAHPAVSIVSNEDGVQVVEPVFSKFMAKLHTSGQEVVSLFRNDFFVPSCAKSISFFFNFLTREYGAQYYNDFMTINIEDTQGNLLKEVYVDQMGIQDQPGTPGGNWLHASGWQRVAFSLVGVPLNQVLRLKIYVDVRNVGDGAFDSVVLLDRLKYNM
jgi:hypothetical protein